MNDYFCSDCGIELEHINSNQKQLPCPQCGSIKRTIIAKVPTAQVAVTAAPVTIGVSAELTPPLATLLLNTVLIPEGETSKGKLIHAVTLPWLQIIEILRRSPNDAFLIPAHIWEEIIAGAYKQAGFDEVILTPRSGDYGRDVIAVKRGIGEVRVIDQVKAYKPGHLVKANDVRALMGVLHCDGASKGFVTTTSDFAPRIKDDPLIKPLIPKHLELINGEQLLRRLDELAKKGI